MEAPYEFSTWRELLGHVTKNPKERIRLAQEADVQPITLRRWVLGTSQPRGENVRRLAQALSPEFAGLFQRLIVVDFPTLLREKAESSASPLEISHDLYRQMFKVYAKMPMVLASQQLQTILLEHALEHLDPHKVGLSLVFAVCVPPVGGQKVRSLRQISGIGLPPWERDLARKTIFLGTESLAGNAVMAAKLMYVESRDAATPYPIRWTLHEESAVAMPILRQGRIAGVLLASSAQPNYFTPMHCGLLELYAQLALLIFAPSDFYDPHSIQLEKMPAYEVQEPYFSQFGQRVQSKQGLAMANDTYVSLQRIHQEVWHEIEGEFVLLGGASE